LKVTEAPRVERAMTIWKNALNLAATEGPDYLVIDLMRGRQALFSWEAIESLPVVVIHG
jgi:type IV secretory pathway ATPase VirB11/archaellum biosynthesis ATPase